MDGWMDGWMDEWVNERTFGWMTRRPTRCVRCSASDAIATTRIIVRSIKGALEAWMSSNRLLLNSAKTQFIWLGTRQQLARFKMAALSVAFLLLTFSSACAPCHGRHPGL